MATTSRSGGGPASGGSPCAQAAAIAAATVCSRRAPTASVTVRTVLADNLIAPAASAKLAAASANGKRAAEPAGQPPHPGTEAVALQPQHRIERTTSLPTGGAGIIGAAHRDPAHHRLHLFGPIARADGLPTAGTRVACAHLAGSPRRNAGPQQASPDRQYPLAHPVVPPSPAPVPPRPPGPPTTAPGPPATPRAPWQACYRPRRCPPMAAASRL